MKKVVVISSSLRSGSNSEIMAKEFAKGASLNNEVAFISLKDFEMKFCLGCLACQNQGKCILKDDVHMYLKDISNADVLVFATPIYYYGMSGQLKTFLDRLNPLYVRKNRFKEVYLLASCADDNPCAIDKTIVSLNGWIECFEGVNFKKSLLATSTTEAKSLSEEMRIKSFNLGKEI